MATWTKWNYFYFTWFHGREKEPEMVPRGHNPPCRNAKVFYSVVFPCDAETFTDHKTKWKSHSSCTIPTKTHKEDAEVNYSKHWIGTIDTTEDCILKHPFCLGHLLKACVHSFLPFVHKTYDKVHHLGPYLSREKEAFST